MKLNKKSLIIHPFIVACLPVLILFSFNVPEIPIIDILLPILISISLTIIFWIVLRYFLQTTKSSLIVSLLILLFVAHSSIFNLFNTGEDNQFLTLHIILGLIFLSIGISSVIFLLKTKSHKELNSIFNVISITIFGFLIFNIMLYQVTNSNEDYLEFIDLPLVEKEINKKPNVFVLIFDEFAGEKQLKMDFDYDLIKFNNELQVRNFLVPNVSLSNYVATEYSTTSFLNMVYLDEVIKKAGEKVTDYKISLKLKAENNVMKILKSHGYKITVFNSGYGEKYNIPENSPYVDEKLCMNKTSSIINQQIAYNVLLPYIPFIANVTHSITNDSYLNQFDECMFSYVENYKVDKTQPHLIYVHIMLPHGGYRYDSDGNHVFRDPNLALDKKGYFEQLLFVEKKSIKMIDAIQKEDPESIIILLSDHGFRGEISEKNTDEDLLRGFNNISALYFPNRTVEIPETLSMVNIFRIFFNEYFEADYKILENRNVIYSTDPFYIEDVTDRLNTFIKK
jgi:hypothetical protein